MDRNINICCYYGLSFSRIFEEMNIERFRFR